MRANKSNSFWAFAFRKEQVPDWLVIVLTTFFACLIVTFFVPYPGTMTDSFGYLRAAIDDVFIPFRPFGYSEYLRVVHVFSDSIYSIVVSQALIYAVSLAFLVLAVKKYWGVGSKPVFHAMEVCVALNFTAIYMLDTIMADSLFCSMIFLMIAMLIVVINEKSYLAFAVYLLAFYVSLHTRYSAMFFPIAFLPVLLLNGSKWMRIVTAVMTVAVFLIFRGDIKENMFESVHKRQFSTGFDGWQLSNNAFHILPYVDASDGMPKDKQLKAMHEFCVDYFDEYIGAATADGKRVTSSFLWDSKSPLKQILYSDMQMRETSYLESWVSLGSTMYADYGKWLILHYPGKFLRYYILPNMKGIFIPSGLEIIGSYKQVPANKGEIVEWFDFPADTSLEAKRDGFFKHMSPVLPWVELLTWILFVAALVLLFVKLKWASLSKETQLVLALIFLFGLIVYGTTTFASPIVLRYWMPMHALKILFVWIVLRQLLVKTNV